MGLMEGIWELSVLSRNLKLLFKKRIHELVMG